MTGYESKKAAALDEDGMYLVHHTKRKDDDDDTQVYGDALTIAYQSGYYDGKKAAQRPWVGLTDEDKHLIELSAGITEDEFELRGKLATLKCWHRLTQEEEEDLLRFAAAQSEQEQNFCPRCGKRTADLTTIHTCTPPRENT